MCLQDIRIARQLSYRSGTVVNNSGQTNTLVGANASRLALAVGLDSAMVIDEAGTIGGSFVPATGVVTETTTNSQSIRPVLVGYNDGNRFCPLVSLTPSSQTALLKLTDYGPVILREIVIKNMSLVNYNPIWTETYESNQLEV